MIQLYKFIFVVPDGQVFKIQVQKQTEIEILKQTYYYNRNRTKWKLYLNYVTF